ncbi:MAG: hypothetical protein ABFD07_19095, partial [Methanobacterium sp.]
QTMISVIGEKRLLISTEEPKKGNVVEMVEVTIKNESLVCGSYGSKGNVGYLAVDSHGNEYTVNWIYFQDLDPDPYRTWYGPRTKINIIGLWFDVTHVLYKVPTKPKWICKFPFVYFCEIHERLCYEECTICKINAGSLVKGIIDVPSEIIEW